MTAEPILPPITCPSSLVAACAPLLGFVPEKSLVAFIHGVPGRVSPVIMRVDLPPDGHAALAAAQAALSIDGTGGVAVDWVAWVEDHDSTRRDDLSCVRFLQELRQALDLVGIEVGGNLSTNGRMWWSHTCTEPECCPSQGTPLDAGIMNSVRAEYVYAGYAPLPSRELLEARIARDAGRMIKVVEVLARRQPARSTQRWRDAQVRILTQLFLPNNSCGAPAIPMTPSRTARMVRALEDIRVRDVVLHRLVVGGHHCDRCWEGTIEVLCDALRAMPEGAGAPTATILALVTWMRGEGALATICIQRALSEDPDYRLGRMAAGLMAQGTDPRVWRASLAGLSESECRNAGRR